MTDLDPADRGRLPDPPAHEPVIGRGFTGYTLADARIDDPEGCRTWEHGVPALELAHRLKKSKQRISQVAAQIGGVVCVVGRHSEWRFPPDTRLPPRAPGAPRRFQL